MTTNRGRTAYFAAAADILAAGGPESLTVTAICERVHVTSGAFYYYFTGVPDFVEQFLRTCEESSATVAAAFAAEADPVLRLERMACRSIVAAHEAEAALHAWGRTHDAANRTLLRAHRRFERLLEETLREIVGDADRAAMLAHMGASMGIGLHQREPPIDQPRLAAIAAEWIRASVGLDVEVVAVGDAPALRLTRRT